MDEIRDELIALSHEHGIPRLAELAEATKRRSPKSKAPTKSATMTPEMAAEIRAVKKANPSLSQMEIARQFNVNPGRVSEALRGKKK